nr:serine/arginine repetitive matrix protein 1-like [Vicugna pacos]
MLAPGGRERTSPFAPPRRRRRRPRPRRWAQSPPRAGAGTATRRRPAPGLGAVTSVLKLRGAQSPGFLQPRKMRGGRRGPERGRQRRHAGGQLQAKPSPSAGTGPLHSARDTEQREDLLLRGLNARAPPRGLRRPQPHPPATTELLPQPQPEIAAGNPAQVSGTLPAPLTCLSNPAFNEL